MYEPCIAIVVQGAKRLHLPDRVIAYDAQRYLVLTVPVPADCETIVAEDGPFLGVVVHLDIKVVAELATAMTSGPAAHLAPTAPRQLSAILDCEMADAVRRLIEALDSELDARVLGPHLVREVLYRSLRGSGGDTLRTLVYASEAKVRIYEILQMMHDSFVEPLDVAGIARSSGMSTSSLHVHFKEITGTSPVQYLKTIRLHKARVLMVQEALSASAAAERVGYESATQFSREFKRLFGASPAAEARKVRAALGLQQVGCEVDRKVS